MDGPAAGPSTLEFDGAAAGPATLEFDEAASLEFDGAAPCAEGMIIAWRPLGARADLTGGPSLCNKKNKRKNPEV